MPNATRASPASSSLGLCRLSIYTFYRLVSLCCAQTGPCLLYTIAFDFTHITKIYIHVFHHLCIRDLKQKKGNTYVFCWISIQWTLACWNRAARSSYSFIHQQTSIYKIIDCTCNNIASFCSTKKIQKCYIPVQFHGINHHCVKRSKIKILFFAKRNTWINK